jgi:fibronectin-binding autotransporter adhesin
MSFLRGSSQKRANARGINAARRSRTSAGRCLRFEALESREMLSTIYWIGRTNLNKWSDPANWQGGLPNASTDVVMMYNNATINVAPDATNPVVNKITFSSGSTISGNKQFSVLSEIDANGATGLISAPLDVMGSLTINVTSSDPGLRITGVVSDTGGIVKTGGGPLTLSGANTYSGGTTIDEGTIKLGSNSALGSSSSDALTVNGGTLDLNGNSISVTSLSGSGGDIINNSSAANAVLTVNNSSACSFSGWMYDGSSKNLGLTKNGTGTLTLSGANTYSGGTTVSLGTLTLGNSSALGSGSVTLNGGTLDLYGYSVTVPLLSGANSFINDSSSGSGSSCLAVDNASDCTYFGRIEIGPHNRAIALAKSGPGIFTLGSSSGNYYTGGTTINGGTLKITSTYSLGTGGLIVDGGTLDLNGHYISVSSISGSSGYIGNTSTSSVSTLIVNGSSSSFGGIIEDAIGASGTKQTSLIVDSGQLILSGANTYTGGTKVNSGILQLGNGESGGSVVGDIIDNSSLVVNRSDDWTYSGSISGAGALTKTGAGTLTLTGTNTYSGGTTIQAGILSINDDSALGTDPSTAQTNITFSGSGTLRAGAGFTLNSNRGILVNSGKTATIDTQSYTMTIDGVISGSGAVTKQGTGTLTLSGVNTYTGSTTINAGTLALRANNANTIGNTSSVTINGSSAVLDIDGCNNSTGPITLQNGAISGTTGVLSSSAYNVQNGTISAILGGGGALTKSMYGTVTLNGNNSYIGATIINHGVLSISSASNLGADGLTFNGGTLRVTASCAINKTTTINIWGGTFDINGANTTLNNSSIISGAGSLTKTGAGTLSLSGTNTSFSGGTTINAGTLQIGNSFAPGTDGLTVNGGTLDLNGNSISVSSLTGNSGLITDNSGSTSSTTTLTVNTTATNSPTFAGSMQETINKNKLALIKTGNGTLTLSGTNAYSGGTTISAGTLEITPTGTLGSGQVVDNGKLYFNLDGASYTMTNEISGSGEIYNPNTSSLTIWVNNFIGAIENYDDTWAWEFYPSLTLYGDVSGGTIENCGDLTWTGSLENGTFSNQWGSVNWTGDIHNSDVFDWCTGNADENSFNLVGNIDNCYFMNTDGGASACVYITGDISGNSTIDNYPYLNINGHINDNTCIRNYSSSFGGYLYLQGSMEEHASIENYSMITLSGDLDGSGALITTEFNGCFYYGGLDLNGYNATFGSISGSGYICNSSSTTSTLTLNVASGRTSAFEGNIDSSYFGDIALVKDGSGTLILNNWNDISGGTTISGGMLQLGNGTTNGTITGNINNNAALKFSEAVDMIFSGNISGNGYLF